MQDTEAAETMHVETSTMEWRGRHTVILGAARQGTALARWLARHGALVTLSDLRSESELAGARAALSDLPIEWVLGAHPPALLDDCDVLFLSGGVPNDVPIVQEAHRRGIHFSNDAQLFLERAPCPTVGITGSAGKTTTTALLGAMAKAAWGDVAGAGSERRVYVGGNIGDPLISYADAIQAGDLAVMELSSFQLEYTTLSPAVAVVLNITPNHLDRHVSMREYTEAKQRILRFQSPRDTAILNRDDPGSWGLRDGCKGRMLAFSLRPLDQDQDGAFVQDGILHLRSHGATFPLLPRARLRLAGEHNVSNALAAFAAGEAAGIPLDAMLVGAAEFQGVAHRLEFVRDVRGVRWYNDSIATAPERTMAALRSFDQPIVLLLGGRDKNLPWDELAALVRQRVDHVVVFGEAAPKILKALGIAGNSVAKASKPAAQPTTVRRCETLEQAVLAAAEVAAPGDVVLLSPGGTSFDAFKDFEERGERFRQCVQAL